MPFRRGRYVTLGLMLAASGAWAQDTSQCLSVDESCGLVAGSCITGTQNELRRLQKCGFGQGIAMPGPQYVQAQDHVVTLPDGIQIVAGKIELSPDQKLARAYALCERQVIRHLFDVSAPTLALDAILPHDPSCAAIAKAWNAQESPQADRAFIEEVARGLSK